MSKRRLTDRQKRRITRNQSQRIDVGSGADGLVVRHFGKEVIVEDTDRRQHQCLLRQNLGDIACGDRVSFEPEQDTGHGVVVAVHERGNLLEKTGFGGRSKPVAANIDRVVIVCAIQPEPNRYLIDRYIVATENLPAKPVLALNKIDLLTDATRPLVDVVHATYEALGIRVIDTSAKRGDGIDELGGELDGHTSILVGLSGIGKSSLVNRMIPDVDARVGDVSAASLEGTHTTTVSTLYRLPGGGQLIDSPGVRDFTPVITSRQQVLNGFIELRRHLGECKFNDCAHESEPGCAVRRAIEQNKIDPVRLQSYRHMLEEIVNS